MLRHDHLAVEKFSLPLHLQLVSQSSFSLAQSGDLSLLRLAQHKIKYIIYVEMLKDQIAIYEFK